MTNTIEDHDNYEKILSENYFYFCQHKKILEIAPADGVHSELIGRHNPDYYLAIEADSHAVESLRNNTKFNKIIEDDVFLAINQFEKFDVVICFGLLYHLPHPYYLLELIVNYNDPEIIILDTVRVDNIISVSEKINVPGYRQVKENWKTCGYNIVLPLENIDLALQHLGYKMSIKHKLNVPFGPKYNNSKNNSWLALWQKDV